MLLYNITTITQCPGTFAVVFGGFCGFFGGMCTQGSLDSAALTCNNLSTWTVRGRRPHLAADAGSPAQSTLWKLTTRWVVTTSCYDSARRTFSFLSFSFFLSFFSLALRFLFSQQLDRSRAFTDNSSPFKEPLLTHMRPSHPSHPNCRDGYTAGDNSGESHRGRIEKLP